MVEAYKTEEEQIEDIKKWWRENWKSLAGGILLGLAILFGGKNYMQSRDAKTGMAAFEYDAMMQALNANKVDDATAHAEILNGQYAGTPFAVAAALTLAKLKVDKNDLLAAQSYLRWALEHADDTALKHAARLRLARVLLAQNKADQAMELVSIPADQTLGYEASYEELKGDILVASGKISEAITAYNLALSSMKPGNSSRQSVQMKLDDLGPMDNAKQAS